jgi:hypothetical protein
LFGDEDWINIEEEAEEILLLYTLEEILENLDMTEHDLVKYLIIEGIIDVEDFLSD